jgi:Zn-dependent metalloprotease
MNRTVWLLPFVAVSTCLLPPALAQAKEKPLDPAGIARLVSDSDGAADVAVNDATGAARFVKAKPGRKLGLLKQAARAASPEAKHSRSSEFFRAYGSIFGIVNADAELRAVRVDKDQQGGTHITYRQFYYGMPVFAGELRSHFDASDELVAVNGTFVPEIAVDTNPRRSAEDASRTAVGKVETDLGRAGELSAAASTLLVFREGLAQGVRGPNHLAWEVEVGDGAGIREFVYVDAQSGKFIDQITGTPDGLSRRAYDGRNLPAPPPEYPNAPFWVEGQSFPTLVTEANNMILASKETYDLFSNSFGRDSFDGAGTKMDAIFNRGYQCPNASWNGTFISFCPGMTSDDVTGHEWTHAYTQYTHNLIYAWQPGALNESYSDIFGETVDRINNRGGDSPDNTRNAAACTAFTPLPPTVTINTPAAIAGVKRAGTAAFGPASFSLTNDVVVANDGGAGDASTDGCCAGPSFVCAANSWPNAAAIAGKIALVDRGLCGFAIKVKNAQVNGAIGVIVGNNQGGTALIGMSGVDPTIMIPSLLVSQNNGTAIKAQPAGTVNAKLSRGAVGTDNSVRWLMGEDDTAPGLTGALRDMWSPACYNNPAKVTDPLYSCGTGDSGGVHNNSGVPNHAYALVVDGGTFNGHTVSGIGLTKAAHIYYRAMSVYQGPASDFADHADALELSCSDLVGANLASLTTGAPSGEVITAGDCAQVSEAIAAVELRTPPSFCNFQPLLAQNPPPLCGPGETAKKRFVDGFDHGDSSTDRWSVSHQGVTATFTARDWVVVSDLPGDRPGKAFFATDPDIGTCAPGGDESGVMHLVSPPITIPPSVGPAKLTFDHWVATELNFDGGNLKVSVDDGPWVLVKPEHFVYNPYNATLATTAQGNTNPLQGQRAFSGTDGGKVEGTWGRSIVDLGTYAPAGSKIRLRFDFGTDGCGGRFGWYVDDLAVYTCQ